LDVRDGLLLAEDQTFGTGAFLWKYNILSKQWDFERRTSTSNYRWFGQSLCVVPGGKYFYVGSVGNSSGSPFATGEPVFCDATFRQTNSTMLTSPLDRNVPIPGPLFQNNSQFGTYAVPVDNETAIFYSYGPDANTQALYQVRFNSSSQDWYYSGLSCNFTQAYVGSPWMAYAKLYNMVLVSAYLYTYADGPGGVIRAFQYDPSQRDTSNFLSFSQVIKTSTSALYDYLGIHGFFVHGNYIIVLYLPSNGTFGPPPNLIRAALLFRFDLNLYRWVEHARIHPAESVRVLCSL
jgi:hypothetical protein